MRREWNGTMNVGNMEQKIIFLTEMQGQLSDGMWENTEPFDHWHPWCSLNWDTVHVEPNNTGVTGNLTAARKRGYRFNSTELLEIVGERIIVKINLWKKLGDKFLEILEKNHWLIPDDGRLPTSKDEYWTKKREKLIELGLTEEVMRDALENGSYTMKDLRNDCAALTKVLKANAKEPAQEAA